MVEVIRVGIKLIKSKDMVFTSGPTEDNILAVGRQASNMVLVYIV